MNNPRAFNRMAMFLVIPGVAILAGGLRPGKAAEQAPLTRHAKAAPSPGRRAEPARRKTPVPARRKGAPVAAHHAIRGVSHASTAARVVREDGEIARLEDRVARQEELLALQQQQITKLVTTVDELVSSLQDAREASSKPAPAQPGPQIVTPPAEVAVVRTGEAAAKPAAVGAARGETLHAPLLASLQPLAFPRLADMPPPASVVPAASPASSSPVTPQAAPDQTQLYSTRLDELSKEVEGISKGIAGFKFSGDFRLRADGVFRSSNAFAGPEQDARGRYRARLNFDKGIDQQLDVHFQLGSGRFDNALTDDTDFGGGAVRGPIFLTEAWVDYHPNSNLSLRGGKMPEVFQDFARFLWDEDVRFNGFQESVGKSVDDNPLGITHVHFRAGQYVLTNPNIQVLPSAAQCAAASPPAACTYLQAGYKPGENVRAADFFDQGVFVDGRIKTGWSHYLYSNFILYRNPNQIALGSTSGGYGAVASNQLGVTLPGPLTGTGSATTMPGGGIYTASHYQIGHLAYRITKEGWKFRSEDFPVFFDVQASRNFGTSFLRNAWEATFNVGEIKKAGDVRFLYFYVVKDANSMVSQFTDDQMGTLSGVNIRTHAIRFDLGLAKFLQWQNVLYIQNEISPNDPARHFYVPLQQGAATQFRFQSSLFANF